MGEGCFPKRVKSIYLARHAVTWPAQNEGSMWIFSNCVLAVVSNIPGSTIIEQFDSDCVQINQ